MIALDLGGEPHVPQERPGVLDRLDAAIVPVEVKAGKTGSLRSLHVFMAEKRSPLAVRFNSEPPSLVHCETPANGRRHGFRLLSLPLYMVGQTRRLMREVLGRA
jgi:hypothetical protein